MRSIQYRHLGRTGLKVSPLCLGTMNFAWKTDEPDAHKIIRHCEDSLRRLQTDWIDL